MLLPICPPFLDLPYASSITYHYGALLTVGTVLSDAGERNKLVKAATGIGETVRGGEMEATGIYFACQRINKRDIPFLVIKGICDWGAKKTDGKRLLKALNILKQII